MSLKVTSSSVKMDLQYFSCTCIYGTKTTHLCYRMYDVNIISKPTYERGSEKRVFKAFQQSFHNRHKFENCLKWQNSTCF